MTATTLRRVRRRLGVSQAGLARLLATTKNSVARMERGEMPVQPPMARLVLLVAHLAERGDDYAVQLAAKAERGRRRRVVKRAPRPRALNTRDGANPTPGMSGRRAETIVLQPVARDERCDT